MVAHIRTKQKSRWQRTTPQSVFSIHGVNKGHWSYEYKTLLEKRQIEEEKKESDAKAVEVGQSYIFDGLELNAELATIHFRSHAFSNSHSHHSST
jgi:hypothetical protein